MDSPAQTGQKADGRDEYQQPKHYRVISIAINVKANSNGPAADWRTGKRQKRKFVLARYRVRPTSL